mgnify:CR=1 FL=1
MCFDPALHRECTRAAVTEDIDIAPFNTGPAPWVSSSDPWCYSKCDTNTASKCHVPNNSLINNSIIKQGGFNDKLSKIEPNLKIKESNTIKTNINDKKLY